MTLRTDVLRFALTRTTVFLSLFVYLSLSLFQLTALFCRFPYTLPRGILHVFCLLAYHNADAHK